MNSAITNIKSVFGKEIKETDLYGLKLEVKLKRIDKGIDTRHIMFSKNKLAINEICDVTSILHNNDPEIASEILKEKGYDFNLNPMAISCKAVELI